MHRWLGPDVRKVLPAAIEQAQAMLTPATNGDFKRTLLPTLVLVSPAGWGQGESVAWQAAAKENLSGIPADLLEIGCKAAGKVADHPSKIIPAIRAAIDGIWSSRRADLSRVLLIDNAANGRLERKPWDPEPFDERTRCTPEEAAAIAAEFGIKSDEPKPAEKPIPTVEDYLAAVPGLTRGQAEKLVAEQKRKAPGKTLGDAVAA